MGKKGHTRSFRTFGEDSFSQRRLSWRVTQMRDGLPLRAAINVPASSE